MKVMKLINAELWTFGPRLAFWVVTVLLAVSTIFAANMWLQSHTMHETAVAVQQLLTSDVFWLAVLVGLIAQAIDGALGMAYGVTSTSFLLATGLPPATASASVHIAEVFTTGISGIAHIKLGNVSRQLFLRLLLPGTAGAAIGAWLISSIDGKMMKPFISAYLLVMGIYILSKVVRRVRQRSHETPRHVGKLALVGGFVDAAGGGGWGPVVTTTLVGTGHDPRLTIGSVNLAEFFLTFIAAGIFTALVPTMPWITVIGLVVGGLISAPFAALMTRRLHARTLMLLVGMLIIICSSYNLWRALV